MKEKNNSKGYQEFHPSPSSFPLFLLCDPRLPYHFIDISLRGANYDTYYLTGDIHILLGLAEYLIINIIAIYDIYLLYHILSYHHIISVDSHSPPPPFPFFPLPFLKSYFLIRYIR